MKHIGTVLRLLLVLVPAASMAAETHERRFNLHIGGLRVAELSLQTQWNGDRFRGRSVLRTVGLARRLYKGFYRVTAKGTLDGMNLRDGSFAAETLFGKRQQNVRMTFKNGRPVSVEAEPPFKPRPWEIAPAAQNGTFDPFSAALLLVRPEPAERICNRKLDIFDGRRRTRITLGKPFASHDGLRCPAIYERVAGFSPKTMRKGLRFEFTTVFKVNAEGSAELWQIFGQTDFGVAVATRTR